MMVYPVQAGREVLHEAQVRVLKILSRAIDAAQAQPVIAPFSGTRCLDDNTNESQLQADVWDVIGDYGGPRGRPSVLLEPDATESTGWCEGSSPGGGGVRVPVVWRWAASLSSMLLMVLQLRP